MPFQKQSSFCKHELGASSYLGLFARVKSPKADKSFE